MFSHKNTYIYCHIYVFFCEHECAHKLNVSVFTLQNNSETEDPLPPSNPVACSAGLEPQRLCFQAVTVCWNQSQAADPLSGEAQFASRPSSTRPAVFLGLPSVPTTTAVCDTWNPCRDAVYVCIVCVGLCGVLPAKKNIINAFKVTTFYGWVSGAKRLVHDALFCGSLWNRFFTPSFMDTEICSACLQ